MHIHEDLNPDAAPAHFPQATNVKSAVPALHWQVADGGWEGSGQFVLGSAAWVLYYGQRR